MVRRGLVVTRQVAQRLIGAGQVRVDGLPAAKPARLVDPGERVELAGPGPRFVGRGGEKLDAALDCFDVQVAGRRALDAGSSTGGFTDCLLQRGAAWVVAVDVGYGQLDLHLRRDPRVAVLERTNIRDLKLGDPALGEAGREPFPLVVADLSFISLRTVAPALIALAARRADVVLLVKPQFEAGRAEASRGRGVIRDPDVWARTVSAVCHAYEDLGAEVRGVAPSSLPGASGNVEFLVHLAAPPVAPPATRTGDSEGAPQARALGARVARAVAEARDTTGSDTTGSDTTGSDTTGSDTTGSDTTGSDTTGSERADAEAQAAGTTGSSVRASQRGD